MTEELSRLDQITVQEDAARKMLKTLEGMRETNALDGPSFRQVVDMIGRQKKTIENLAEMRREAESNRQIVLSATKSSFVIGIYGSIDVESPIRICVIEVQEPPSADSKFFVHLVDGISAGRNIHDHVMPAVNNSLKVIASKRGLKKVPLRMVFAGPRYTPRSLLVDLHPHFDGYQYLDIRGGSGVDPTSEAVPSPKGGMPAIKKSVSELYLIQSAQRGIELGKKRFVFDLPKPGQLNDLHDQLKNFSKKSFRDQEQTALDDFEKDFSLAIVFMVAWHGCEPWA